MTAVFKVVSLSDAALDVSAMGRDVAAYARGRDPALVREVIGKKLTWFSLRQIPTSLFQRFVLEGTSDADRHRRAFMVGVIAVENLCGMDGRTREMFEPVGQASTPAGPLAIWTDEQMELIAPAYLEEIGSVAEARSFLPPNTAVSCVLPPSLVRVLTARVYQDAATSAPNGPSSAGHGTETLRPGPSTDEPTAAPATDAATSEQEASQTPAGSSPPG